MSHNGESIECKSQVIILDVANSLGDAESTHSRLKQKNIKLLVYFKQSKLRDLWVFSGLLVLGFILAFILSYAAIQVALNENN